MKALFARMKARAIKAGASISVTLQSLSLGAQGSTTGQYLKGYIPSTIDMIIIQKSVNKTLTPAGEFLQVEADGYTDTQVFEGDEVKDANGDTWLIERVEHMDIGDQNIYYQCTLKATLPPGSERTYRYPPPPTGSGTQLTALGTELSNPIMSSSVNEVTNERTVAIMSSSVSGVVT